MIRVLAEVAAMGVMAAAFWLTLIAASWFVYRAIVETLKKE